MEWKKMLPLFSLFLVGGCASTNQEPIRTAVFVDLQRFAGDWYVIANIPTLIETEAYNAIESYSKPLDGKVSTTFTFNKGSFNGEEKIYKPTGFVREGTGNAVWGMQFVWPFKAEYRVIHVDSDYQFTIIGRSKRDYVWIMSRERVIDSFDYSRLLKIVSDEGYDLSKLRRIPHRV